MSSVESEWVMSRSNGVMSRLEMSHVTCRNESCHTHEWVTSHRMIARQQQKTHCHHCHLVKFLKSQLTHYYITTFTIRSDCTADCWEISRLMNRYTFWKLASLHELANFSQVSSLWHLLYTVTMRQTFEKIRAERAGGNSQKSDLTHELANFSKASALLHVLYRVTIDLTFWEFQFSSELTCEDSIFHVTYEKVMSRVEEPCHVSYMSSFFLSSFLSFFLSFLSHGIWSDHIRPNFSKDSSKVIFWSLFGHKLTFENFIIRVTYDSVVSSWGRSLVTFHIRVMSYNRHANLAVSWRFKSFFFPPRNTRLCVCACACVCVCEFLPGDSQIYICACVYVCVNFYQEICDHICVWESMCM